jgi:ribosomal protein S18 acetylase RimI-like enzyme
MKGKGIEIREIHAGQLRPDLLIDFDRTQEVKRVVRIVNGQKRVVHDPFVESWDHELKREIVFGDFAESLEVGGRVYLAYEGGQLLGFATLEGELMGPKAAYLQLIQLHVSFPDRGRGVGAILFDTCAKMAKTMGAKKLYISSHSALETQAFYKKMGCKDAEWIFQDQVEREPYDIQLEYVIE